MLLTAAQMKIVGWGAAAVVAWLLWPDDGARVTKVLVIDDNVYSPTFGEPLSDADAAAQAAADRAHAQLVAATNAAAAAVLADPRAPADGVGDVGTL